LEHYKNNANEARGKLEEEVVTMFTYLGEERKYEIRANHEELKGILSKFVP
jgi:hypothetical protein